MPAAVCSPKKIKTPLGLPAEWFWDVNPARLDTERHAAQIIERILVVAEHHGLAKS